MEAKKNKKYDLEPKRPLFFGIGLILSLSLVITAFEWKTELEPIIGPGFDPKPWEILDTPITKHEVPKPPKPKPKKKAVLKIEATKELEKAAKEVEVEIDLEPTDVEIADVFVGSASDEVADNPFIRVEKMPEFPGGEKALLKFLADNLEYPRQARNMTMEGLVTVQFVIERDGSVSEVVILKGIGAGCDEEALRVVNLLPDFSPGKQRGVPVRVQMVVPIHFKLH